jgi:epoxyqueuosine reductase
VERGRTRQGLVRADQVAPVVPAAADGRGARHGAGNALRRSGLLTDPAAIRAALDALAASEGFDAVGVTRPDARPDLPAKLAEALTDGHHGTMGWMADTADRRTSPSVLWPDARSVIILGLNYGPDQDPLAILSAKDRGAISVYAQGDDYHDVIKGKLKRIAQALAARTGADVKVFVDTAPLMEKPLAEAAGLGWQGKHTNLVSRARGSWLFLGAILTTLELAPDTPERDHCGSCRACLDICPTAAFPAPYRLDARRCLSYLTIEHKGPIPVEFRAAMGNRIYGCDDCLAVCPWNKYAQAGREAKLAARDALRAPALADLVALDDAAFRALFAKSPVKRIGRDRFLRNVLIAIGNSGQKDLVPAVIARLDDTSPLVRGAAVWALKRLAPEEGQRPQTETDPDVLTEWDRVAAAPAQ